MNKEIVTRIQTIIDHLELSVSAFADEIGVQRSSISHLLNGRNKPSLDFVMKLVNTYPEVDLYWLLKGEGDFPKKADTEIKIERTETPGDLKTKTDGDSKNSFDIDKHLEEDTEPYKIVFFYSDGSFKTFNPKKD
ncbi:MAG: transcriptional regulator [Muricauda sp.]|nr:MULTISPECIES: helix-turn-helix transcriptional regulator [unclassified Allomuricauda]MAU16061.1 transcriptional regulator [Allomuricauda sp.]